MPVCASCGQDNPPGAAFCNACGSALAAAALSREQRKTVTVLFCDVTGSTALGERLDPESLRRVLARYFEVAREAVERHGGSVEKFIGDAVMAVFGVPRVHEDDALRALRAAVELRAALDPLNSELQRDYGTTLTLRIGVNTGEVVTGTEERLATGDAVNVAARLEQAAEPGDILVGPETVGLVRDAVTVETLTPLELKGKSEPLPAYRLVSLDSDAPATRRRQDAAMVGRDRQLKLLRDAFEHVVSERSCHLFTVLGSAGVGKSRLVAEFLRMLAEPTVLRGRCLSYGEGITYFPVVEIVKQAGGTDALKDEAARKTLDALLGEGDGGGTPSEAAWAFRKLLEAKAEDGPVLCLLDDIQWGEDTLLDLVEHVADLSRGAPILLLCMARPELLDRRPTWAGGKLNATSVLLEPLSEQETDELITELIADSRLDGDLKTRISRAAGGNPLFVEEMLALVGQSGNGGDVRVPPTIQALLAARLDQLDPHERHVLERGSVEGEVFHRGGVAALGREETQLDTRLSALVRKDLVRPERAQLAGDDGYRFRHLLIRDAAYGALPKATRAELHERFADWLGERGGDLVDLDEIVGYHLEQAYRYREELGPLGERERNAARRAGELLARAGRRALDRTDRRAAASLLARAEALLGDTDELRVRTLLDLGRCLAEVYDDLEGGRRALERAREEAVALGRDDLELLAELELSYVHHSAAVKVDPEVNEALSRRAIRVLEEHGDDEGLARAWYFLALAFWTSARWDDMLEPLERSAAHARRAGNRNMELGALTYILSALIFGSTPADEGVARGRAILEEVGDSLEQQAWALRVIGTLLALQDRLDNARELLARARETFRQLGAKQALSVLAFSTGALEILAGDFGAAEREYVGALELVHEMGDRARVSNLAAELAHVLVEQERLDEAEHYATVARETTNVADTSGQVAWRLATAHVVVRRGAADEAVRLAGEAIALARGTSELFTIPRQLRYHADVLDRAGHREDAVQALRESVDVATRKGALAEVRLAREQLVALGAA